MEQLATRRYAELDAYRGIAALMIVALHTYLMRQPAPTPMSAPDRLMLGFASGVTFFFVLSGFVVFLPFARAALGLAPPPTRREFLLRRAARLLPAYYVALLVVWLWRYQGHPWQWVDLAEHLTFVHSLDPRYIASPATIAPAWSLACEVLYYLLVAVLGPVLARRRRHPLALVAVILPLIGLSLATGRVAATFGIAGEPIGYFNPLVRFDGFGIGMLLAVAVARREGVVPTPIVLRLWPVAGMCGTVALPLLWLARPRFDQALIALAYAAVLGGTALGMRGSRWERALSRRPLLVLGAVSYGVYLWHVPILEELRRFGVLTGEPTRTLPDTLIVAGASIIIATASYRYLERPVMRRTRSSPASPSPPTRPPRSALAPGASPHSAR